jgi:hypothetical protein
MSFSDMPEEAYASTAGGMNSSVNFRKSTDTVVMLWCRNELVCTVEQRQQQHHVSDSRC